MRKLTRSSTGPAGVVAPASCVAMRLEQRQVLFFSANLFGCLTAWVLLQALGLLLNARATVSFVQLSSTSRRSHCFKKSFDDWRQCSHPFTTTTPASGCWLRFSHGEGGVGKVQATPIDIDGGVQIPPLPWLRLAEHVLQTTTGKQLVRESQLRKEGLGQPHIKASLRLFDTATEDVRVTLYRDEAAWCPYCQKVWIFLEEKRIPYHVKRVPLNAYGDKPAWYTRLVDGGKLPAVELDGNVVTESLEIMRLLDAESTGSMRMVPAPNTREAQLEAELFELELELQRDWFSLVFYPVKDEALDQAQEQLLATLQRVDKALSKSWFLGGETPALIDIHFIALMERIVASVLYWKGLVIRNTIFPNLDRWLRAWEARPSYAATRSDNYTLVMSMPSQNGPGYFSPNASKVSAQICGLDGAWELNSSANGNDDDDEEGAARHEAAFCLVDNHDAIVSFAARGAGEPGRPSFHAELADPYAEPSNDFIASVDVCLRLVTQALLEGVDDETTDSRKALLVPFAGSGELRENWEEYAGDDGRAYYWNWETGETTWTPPTRQVDTCLAYLRDRIGVPRDMGPAAAMQLRKHLNWVIGLLQQT